MKARVKTENGASLIEVIIAMGVLCVGMLGAAAVLTQGMEKLQSSPGDVVITQKATEAIEAVFAARDSDRLPWAKIRNVNGAAGDGGVFLDGPQPVKEPGPDGLVNTADDTTLESNELPGPDQLLGTSDDTVSTLKAYSREIKIRDITGESGNLRSVVVTVTYDTGAGKRTFTLTTYISNYS